MEGDKNNREIHLFGNQQGTIGLEELAGLDQSKDYTLVMLTRVSFGTPEPQDLKPPQIIEYLEEVREKTNYAAIVEVPR
ncbi:hypothetical protein ACFL96_04070 [Thermoproteota archaeon]